MFDTQLKSRVGITLPFSKCKKNKINKLKETKLGSRKVKSDLSLLLLFITPQEIWHKILEIWQSGKGNFKLDEKS